MANDEAMSAVVALISELDVDVDPASRAKIVVYLEHAKSEDVASVLSNLAESGRSNDEAVVAHEADAPPRAQRAHVVRRLLAAAQRR